MEKPEAESLQCFSCHSDLPPSSNFCRVCGIAQNQEQIIIHSKRWPALKEIAVFLSIELTCCIAVRLIPESIGSTIIFDTLMALTAITFFIGNWEENKHLLKWPDFSLKKLLFYIILSFITSITLNILIEYINKIIFHQSQFDGSIYNTHPYGKYMMIVSLAIFPALFEELAYRGYLMQRLLNVVAKKEAIYISSFLFFLMHFSIISFFWLIPFAMILTYIRLKEKTIWYGVFIHLIFNLTYCLIDILGDYYPILWFNN